jgi:hypothetical protein
MSMDELIRLSKKAANEWRNTDAYYQAAVLIDSLCARLEKIENRNPQTNADRIRAMSDEELAEWLVKKTKYQESAWSEPSYLNFLTEMDDTMESAIKGTVEWIKQPAEVEHG